MSVRPRTLDIESALSWAYNDELCKREAAPPLPRRPVAAAPREYASSTTAQLIVEMGENRFGVLRSVGVQGTAHPDAVLIGETVNRLHKLEITFPDDWCPLVDLAGIGPETDRLIGEAVALVRDRMARGERIGGLSIAALVQRHALARTAPDWRVLVPELRMEAHPNGQPKWFVRRTTWTNVPRQSERSCQRQSATHRWMAKQDGHLGCQARSRHRRWPERPGLTAEMPVLTLEERCNRMTRPL